MELGYRPSLPYFKAADRPATLPRLDFLGPSVNFTARGRKRVIKAWCSAALNERLEEDGPVTSLAQREHEEQGSQGWPCAWASTTALRHHQDLRAGEFIHHVGIRDVAPAVGDTGEALSAGERGERLDSAQEGAHARDMTHVAGADTCFERPCTVAEGAAQAASMAFAKLLLLGSLR